MMNKTRYNHADFYLAHENISEGANVIGRTQYYSKE